MTASGSEDRRMLKESCFPSDRPVTLGPDAGGGGRTVDPFSRSGFDGSLLRVFAAVYLWLASEVVIFDAPLSCGPL